MHGMLRFPRYLAAALLLLGTVAKPSLARTEGVLVEEIEARRELLAAAFEWLDATLSRDFAAQSRFYPQTMDAFYLWRNVPKSAVLAEKRRVFEKAEVINMTMEPPVILVDAGARSARMYFRKAYVIKSKLTRNGEVLQELRWVKDDEGWKIVSERDLRVIPRAARQP